METKLEDLPNIGKTLAEKLVKAGISNSAELKRIGSKNAIIKISALKNSGACINMLYALEGAIQETRWHDLSRERKEELLEFYRRMEK